MNGNDVKSASVESNANNYSKQPQKASQQEHQVRETRQRKDIQRSSQVVNQPLNNENHSINRKERSQFKLLMILMFKNDKYKMRHRINKVDNLEIVINLLRVIISQKTV